MPLEPLDPTRVVQEWISHHQGSPPCPLCNEPMEAPVEPGKDSTPEAIEQLPLCHRHGYFLQGKMYSLEQLISMGY